MLRILGLCVALCLPFAVMAQTGPKPLASALDAARAGNWDNARALAQRAGAPAPDLIEWHRLRAGAGSLAEARAFLARNPDWPGLALLRKRTEAQAANASTADVLAFFASDPPQTGPGALAYARALVANGQKAAAAQMLANLWPDLALDEGEFQALLAAFPAELAPHHIARTDNLLWRGAQEQAQRMLPLLPSDWQALARARIALRAERDGVDSLIAAVPAALAANPGLAYDRFHWRIRKGRTEDALQLLLERSGSAADLGQPTRWAGWRTYLARSLMREGQAAQAYMAASSHQLPSGSAFAELEWLSGYLALRYLGDPALARDHFQRLRSAVSTPISLGRAGYWIGRAQEALGDQGAARIAYAEGGQHQTSFYGLLAAERGGLPPDASLRGDQRYPDWRQAQFTQSRVFQAAVLALNAGQTSLAEQFFIHLAEGLDATALGQLGQMAQDLSAPHLAVMIGKEAAGRGITLPGPYYALHPLQDMAMAVPTELALAIARRESEFDPAVVSGAGAQGLMQLMPATAAEMAKKLGLTHDPQQVLADPAYNARLGTAYLAHLAERFEGNVVMMAAAYNAGPSRPERWMAELGDPRQGQVDIVDWIEHLPFNETRNYVMRVSESLPVYRARLGRAPHPVPFSQELVGRTMLAK